MRISIGKSKNNEFVYLVKDFYSNGSRTTKIIEKLGTLDYLMQSMHFSRDQVIVWAKDYAKQATEKDNDLRKSISLSFSPSRIIDANIKRSFNCGYLFLQSLYSGLRFDNITRNIKGRHDYSYDLNAILSDLIYSRILHPSSKMSSFDFAHTLLEQPKYELHHVYRALSVLAEESDYIQSEVYRNSNFIHNRNTKVLYYDCTNYYFEIQQEDGFKKYGKSKENRPNPIVGMGLFMDGDGMPLAFDLHSGNQNEQKTLKPLEQKVIRDYDCSEFVYCSDSGLGSQDNKLFNTIGNRSYVITQSLKKLKQEDRDIALNPTHYRKVGSDTFIDLRELDETDSEVYHSIYYKEIPLESKKVSETLIITYSPKYKVYQSTIRKGQIERAQKIVKSGSKVKKTHHNPNDPARFIKKTAVTTNGEVAEEVFTAIDEQAIQKEAMYDGFYGVSTNMECDIMEIIAINKRRWQIEECFRIIKTEFEARPIYLQREDRIKAHFLICFLSLLIYRLLEVKLENKYTVEQIIDTLKEITVLDTLSEGYLPAYERTELTDKLHEIFGFRTDYEIITKQRMRNIIKKTKNH